MKELIECLPVSPLFFICGALWTYGSVFWFSERMREAFPPRTAEENDMVNRLITKISLGGGVVGWIGFVAIHAGH
jgi:hypothetical protein